MNGMKLNEESTKELVDKVGRCELFEEMEAMKSSWMNIPYPRYLKAVRVTLTSLGFDPEWVEHDFRNALEAKYLKKKRNK